MICGRRLRRNLRVWNRLILAHGPQSRKEKVREFGLKFWRPTNSESRSESCSENSVSHKLGRECHSKNCSENTPEFRESLREWPFLGFGKGGLLEKGSFQKSPFSRDSREFRDSRDSREPPDCGKQRRIRPFSRDSREFRDFRDSRDSSSEKTPFVMTPFSGPDFHSESVFFQNWGGPQVSD